MKRQLAHAMRRTARRLIAWSNRLDGPTGSAIGNCEWILVRPPSDERRARYQLVLNSKPLCEVGFGEYGEFIDPKLLIGPESVPDPDLRAWLGTLLQHASRA